MVDLHSLANLPRCGVTATGMEYPSRERLWRANKIQSIGIKNDRNIRMFQYIIQDVKLLCFHADAGTYCNHISHASRFSSSLFQLEWMQLTTASGID